MAALAELVVGAEHAKCVRVAVLIELIATAVLAEEHGVVQLARIIVVVICDFISTDVVGKHVREVLHASEGVVPCEVRASHRERRAVDRNVRRLPRIVQSAVPVLYERLLH